MHRATVNLKPHILHAPMSSKKTTWQRHAGQQSYPRSSR